MVDEGRLLLASGEARPWPVALALDPDAPRPLGAVVAPDVRAAARAALQRWPLLPVNAATVGGLTIGEVLANLAPDKPAGKPLPDKPLTVGQQRYRDWLRVRSAGRRSAGQRKRLTNTTPRPA